MAAPGIQQWAVIVPLKPLDRGKSRLEEEDQRRSQLALAFARDVVAAALGVAAVIEVLVVTDDPRATAVLRADGARVISDTHEGGLNAAFEHGATSARERNGEVGVAALAGDLPAVTTAELDEVLTLAWPRRRCYVPDADDIGTTLLTARPGVWLGALFGVASSDEHLASGAYLLDEGVWPGLRRDVDTPADLEAAMAIGVGPATAAVLGERDLP